MLAGLISEGVGRGSTGVPGLSRIPVLGGLFGMQGDSTSRDEVIVLITPTVVRNPQEARDADRRIRQPLPRAGTDLQAEEVSRSDPDLPIVLVPVGTDDDALDACLAALDAGTPAGTRVWLADDAQAGPRGMAIIEGWLARTRLQAAHTRRAAPLGEAAHLDEALRACGDSDVAVLASRRGAGAGLAGSAGRMPGARSGDRQRHALEQCRRGGSLAADRRDRRAGIPAVAVGPGLRAAAAGASGTAGGGGPRGAAARSRPRAGRRAGCRQLSLLVCRADRPEPAHGRAGRAQRAVRNRLRGARRRGRAARRRHGRTVRALAGLARAASPTA